LRGQLHALAATYPRERPVTHCTGGWVGLRAGLDWCGEYEILYIEGKLNKIYVF